MDSLGEDAPLPHHGWRSRGFIPHFEGPNLVQSITYRLADSLPQNVLRAWKDELGRLPANQLNEEIAVRTQEFLDSGYGSCVLKQAECAASAQEKLLERDGEEYMLIAWVIMPNHVHVLAEIADDAEMDEIVRRWKGGSSILINRHLSRTGRLWQVEYFDRYIRSAKHLRASIEYIENNPVQARLATVATEFPWSSAAFRNK